MEKMSSRQKKQHIDKIIGQNIRNERESRKMSREELAEMMELTVSHMGLIERGERGATAVTLSKLADVFNSPIDVFFTTPDKPAFLIREEEYDEVLTSSKRKMTSLMTRLDSNELDFLIQTTKGLIALKQNEMALNNKTK